MFLYNPLTWSHSAISVSSSSPMAPREAGSSVDTSPVIAEPIIASDVLSRASADSFSMSAAASAVTMYSLAMSVSPPPQPTTASDATPSITTSAITNTFFIRPSPFPSNFLVFEDSSD